MNAEGNLYLINKPVDWTSFDVVKYLRNALGGKGVKIGHAGTLDPLASGLLVVLTGKMLKRVSEIQQMEKEYSGTITLGGITPSYDLETQVMEPRDVSHITENAIAQAALAMTGEQWQSPPAYSAAKVGGRRAYELARAGKEVKTEPKRIVIHQFEIVKVEMPDVHFRVVCSKGTYIRTLAHELGQKLGCGGYLSALCRTRIGNFLLKDALEPKEFDNSAI